MERILTVSVVFALLLTCPMAGAAGSSREDVGEMRQMRYSPRSEAAALQWQTQLRTELFRVLRIDDLVARQTPVPFAEECTSSTDKKTYRTKELQVQLTPTRRIPIFLTLPPADAKGPFPAVVCINGHSGNRHSPYFQETFKREGDIATQDQAYGGFGTLLAERGFITISTDMDVRTESNDHKVFDPARTLMGERLWCAMRCVDYVSSLPDVDASRIGCAGLSLGGEIAMWLAAMDVRISACVSCGFLGYMDDFDKYDACPCWKAPGLRELIDFPDLGSLVAPRPLQCQMGLQESGSLTPFAARRAMEELRQTYVDLGKPENVSLDIHIGGHVVDTPSLVWFLEKHLMSPPASYNPWWKDR